jgi:hypothetical protein
MWGPLIDDADQQQLGAIDCDLAKYVGELGEPLLAVANSGPRRRYLVCETLNVSRWAGVYTAIDCCADRVVVLKISRHVVDREARLAVGARHPNVITVFDAFVCEGHPTMVMEWCPQGTLLNYARLCEDWKQVLVRGLEAGRGLAHFHAQGKVHGDVKPTNILVVDDVGKLADFGIARSETDEGDVVGTPFYAPPERDHGVWKSAGDVYSYAKTLEWALEKFSVPKRVRVLLDAAMVDDPERRPTMKALLADLDRAIDPALPRSRVWMWFQAATVALCAAIVTSTVVLASVCSPPDDGRERTTRWAIEITLKLAAESAESGDGESAVQYLSLAHSRARRESDRFGERSVAEHGMLLARQLGEQGDIDNALQCLSIARDVFRDEQDHRGLQRVAAVEHELNSSATTRAPRRSN